MIRFVVVLLGILILIPLVRSIVGIILKGFADLVKGPSSAAPPSQPRVPLSGELKRDPVCGTYVSAASSIKKNVGGQVVYFCSANCRDKYKAS